MDKRGQVFGFILVFVTLFLAGIVVGLYYIQDEARGAGEEFLRNTLYPESQTEYFGNELIFRRAVVGKKIVLVAEETSDIHFPIDFKYEYSKEYRITKVGDSFEIR
jgi:hypothetical protein